MKRAPRRRRSSDGCPAVVLPRVFLAFGFSAAITACATEQSSNYGVVNREYAIKAAYLYNFARYVTWPSSVFSSDAAPFVIGVVGPDPVASYLDQIARRKKKIGVRHIVVRRCRTAEQCVFCHILFVGKTTDAQRRQEILRRLGDAPVLLVGETSGFGEQGGIINFYLASNKVRFEINPHAAKQKNLKISARLLALARIVPVR